MESKHAGENIGLFDTVLSPEEYAALYSSQQASMSDIGYDNSEMPSFTAAVVTLDAEEDPQPTPVKKKQQNDVLKIKKPVITQNPVVRVIPQSPKKEPIQPQISAKTAPKIDISSIKVGSALTHKAFGVGVVKSIDNQYILLDFSGTEKKFMFPAALLQGFLKME